MASAAKHAQMPIAVPAVGGVCDLTQGTYFTSTMNGNTAFSFVKVPADVTVFELEVNLVAGAPTFPANVRWARGIPPADLQAGKLQFFHFMRPQSLRDANDQQIDQWVGSFWLNS